MPQIIGEGLQNWPAETGCLMRNCDEVTVEFGVESLRLEWGAGSAPENSRTAVRKLHFFRVVVYDAARCSVVDACPWHVHTEATTMSMTSHWHWAVAVSQVTVTAWPVPRPNHGYRLGTRWPWLGAGDATIEPLAPLKRGSSRSTGAFEACVKEPIPTASSPQRQRAIAAPRCC